MFILCTASCTTIDKSAKKQLNDGYYKMQQNKAVANVYVAISDSLLRIYPLARGKEKTRLDSSKSPLILSARTKNPQATKITLHKPSLDFDFLTIPLKLRGSKAGVPAQLNTNLNGAVYLGYRTDKYVVRYLRNPLEQYERKTNHFGFSFGLFTGFGNTFMSPTNTADLLPGEYDGVVWSKGVAGIVAVNAFTVGIALGMDHLLDKNHRIWIYQTQPYVGLTFGLNLN